MAAPIDCPPRVPIESATTDICERIPNYYTTNTFEFDNPEIGLKWLANITKSNNLHKLRKVYCHVSRFYNPEPESDPFFSTPPDGPKWVEFINALAALASPSGLQEATFYLDAEQANSNWGAAVDPKFVQAVGGMRGLRKLEIDGFFPKEWPKYLNEKTDLQVWQKKRKSQEYLQKLNSFQNHLNDQVIE